MRVQAHADVEHEALADPGGEHVVGERDEPSGRRDAHEQGGDGGQRAEVLGTSTSSTSSLKTQTAAASSAAATAISTTVTASHGR